MLQKQLKAFGGSAGNSAEQEEKNKKDAQSVTERAKAMMAKLDKNITASKLKDFNNASENEMRRSRSTHTSSTWGKGCVC